MCRKLSYTALALVVSLMCMATAYGDDVIWDFENGNDHGFSLWSANPATPAPDDPATAGEEALTGAGGSKGLPGAGVAWSIGRPDQYDGLKPPVQEGDKIKPDGTLEYNQAGKNHPFTFPVNGRGQENYLNTYNLTEWGDNLHAADNDQIATSPFVLIGENAQLTVWAYGGGNGTHAPALDSNPSQGYTAGSAGVAVRLAADGSLLASVLTNGHATLKEDTINLSAYAGLMVYIEVVDAFQGGWGWLAVDEIRITNAKALIIAASDAFKPKPADGATYLPRDVVLRWAPGEYANKHDVYFGTNPDDVNNAAPTVDLSGIYKGRQDPNYYPGNGTLNLEFGQTYYWRIDEVNAPPDFTVYKGNVWSFTVETFAYPIPGEQIVATASSAISQNSGPEKTVDSSGLDDNDLHSTEGADMWLSSSGAPQPAWLQYEFDRIYKLHEMWVWNHNTILESAIGFGIKEATIEYSTNGTNWTTLGTTHEFAVAPGSADYAPNTTVALGGVTAKYVKITANSNWGGIVSQFGLSEVRFLYIPVWAREPRPYSGTTDIGPDGVLGWRAGREAAAHNVYLSADEQAVIDGTAPAVTVTSPSYASSLDLAGTYYWRIDEVNEAEVPSSWQGDVWSFSTQEYLVVDDFESYNDIDAGQEGSFVVFGLRLYVFCITANGSTIGYFEAFQPSMEKTLVYDGNRSVPLFYNNTTASLSEVTANVADLQAGRDWAKHGIKALTLRFFGDPTNAAQRMYVKINGTKVTYDGSAENLKRTGWQMWYIDLASLGVNLGNVSQLTIGLERIGTAGGQGMVLLDAIRLYAYDRQLITPADPGTANLQAQYPFEGNANDSSGKGRNGTAMGGPLFVAGKVGQAISLDGTDDYVTIAGYKGILADAAGVQQPFTITAWVKTTDSGDRTIASWGTNTSMLRVDFRLFEGRLRVEHGAGNIQGDTALNDDNWHHVALTMIQGATISYPEVQLWLDGKDNTRGTTDPDPFSVTAGVDMAIGYRATAAARYFLGAIDGVCLYDRVLSEEEIAWLAGQTSPFDKPF